MRTALELAIRSLKSFGSDNASVFAAGITYLTLLSLFPLMLFALSAAGFFYQEPADQRELVNDLLDYLPIDSSDGRDNLEELIGSVVEARGTLGVIALLGAAYSGSALFGSVRTSLNAVYGAERKRPFWLAKLIDLLMVFGFTLLLLVSVGITVGISLAQRFSEDLFGAAASAVMDRLLAVAWALVPTAISAALFFLLFTYVPAKRLGWRHTIWGAIVAAVLFELLKFGFTVYVNNFGNYNATYGAIGFVIILLVFVNLSAQVMLLGAEVARSSFEMEDDGSGRFRETEALGIKVRALERKLPFVDGLVPGEPDRIPAEGLAAPFMAEEYAEAAPLTTASAMNAGALSFAPVALGRRAKLEQHRRPGAFSSLMLLGGVLALALGVRHH